MPLYDFFCKECEILVEDEFFKIADEKIVRCKECEKQMNIVVLQAPALKDPGGVGQKWVNDGYQMRDEKSGNLRIVKEKWENGKNVIRSDAHDDSRYNTTLKRMEIKEQRVFALAGDGLARLRKQTSSDGTKRMTTATINYDKNKMK